MQAGRIVSREDIKDALWPDHEYLSHDKVINNGIGRLRRVFEDDYLNCKYIECVPGSGYRFKSEVEQLKVDQGVTGPSVPDGVALSMAGASNNQHGLMEDEVSTAALAGKLWNLGFAGPCFAMANRGFDKILRTWFLVGLALRTYCSSWYIRESWFPISEGLSLANDLRKIGVE
jgi:hypothetical protein